MKLEGRLWPSQHHSAHGLPATPRSVYAGPDICGALRLWLEEGEQPERAYGRVRAGGVGAVGKAGVTPGRKLLRSGRVRTRQAIGIDDRRCQARR
jgi:hypothetical protein